MKFYRAVLLELKMLRSRLETFHSPDSECRSAVVPEVSARLTARSSRSSAEHRREGLSPGASSIQKTLHSHTALGWGH